MACPNRSLTSPLINEFDASRWELKPLWLVQFTGFARQRFFLDPTLQMLKAKPPTLPDAECRDIFAPEHPVDRHLADMQVLAYFRNGQNSRRHSDVPRFFTSYCQGCGMAVHDQAVSRFE